MQKQQILAVLATAFASASVLTACGSDSEGVGDSGASTGTAAASSKPSGQLDESEEPIVVALNALKIPAVDLLTSYEAGANAAAKQINAQGGFGGRKVVIESCNTAYQPATAVVCARKTLAKKPVASIGAEPTWGTSGLPLYAKAKVPSITSPNSEEEYTNPLAIAMTQGTAGGQRAMARYLCTRDDVKKVAVFTQDVPFQHTSAPATVTPVLKECGKSASFTYYPITGGDLAPHVNKATKDEPDFVITLGGGTLAVQIFRSFRQAGIAADRIIISANAMAYETVLKPGGDALEGAYAAFENQSWSDTEDPGVAEYLKAMEGSGVDPRDGNPLTGFVQLMTIYTAAKEIGFEKFDSASLTEYLNTANEVAVPGTRELINPGPDGFEQVKQPFSHIVQWKDGTLNSVTEGTEDGWVPAF